MTTRNFDALFDPKAIAFVGASNRQGSVGAATARNLSQAGFKGALMMVNPHDQEVAGTAAYPSVAALPQTPDLAVIATPAPGVPVLIDELGARGCRAAIVISAGFSEGDLRRKMLDAAKPRLMRILGPNCLGFISPANGVNASFAHLMPAPGRIALLSQSGAVLTSMIDWAAGKGIGFSHVLSLGDMSDVDFGDLLDYLALDPATDAILLYVESVTQARKFMSAGRIAARAKPVIVVKSGRSVSGARAAATHTGALAGADLVYDAAFRRAGMLRVDTLRDLFDAAETLASGVRVRGNQLTILTNGGGVGVLAVDALEGRGAQLAPLSDVARAQLDKVLPPTWSHANPIDIIGDADASRYARALEILLTENTQDAVLVMNCPTGVADGVANAQAVLKVASEHAGAPLLTCWLGEATANATRNLLSSRRMPAYETPDEAVRAFAHLVDYKRNQDLLCEVPTADKEITTHDREIVRAILAKALDGGRSMLSEPEAKAVLAAYHIPTVPTWIAATPAEAARRATDENGPFAIKILSPDISHKSDVGGVRLNLPDAAAVETAAAEMLKTVTAKAPSAQIEGFTLQPMISRPRAVELIAGVTLDATFGPTLLFGQGGVQVEVVADRAMALPPLNSVLAAELMERTRVANLLRGYRDVPAANMDAICDALIGLSNLASDFAEIVAIDINPLLADDSGVIALDARVEIRPAIAPAPDRLAIRPYPQDLAQAAETKNGARVLLRPIRPDDEPALVAMCAACTPEDLRLRFFGPVPALPHVIASRLSQIDYDREMTFVAEGPDGYTLCGLSHMVIDPNFKRADFDILVGSDFKGEGIGYQLMQALLGYARARGVESVGGEVLRENRPMLQMIDALHGRRLRHDDGKILRVEFALMP